MGLDSDRKSRYNWLHTHKGQHSVLTVLPFRSVARGALSRGNSSFGTVLVWLTVRAVDGIVARGEVFRD